MDQSISSLLELPIANDGYSIELQDVEEAGWPSCTATVYHYGEAVESFTVCNLGSWNCMMAEGYARSYISSKGGPGWSTQLPIIKL